MPDRIDNKDKLRAFVTENIGEIMRENPDVLFTALAADKDALQRALADVGFSVSERRGIDHEDILDGHRQATAYGAIDGGRGASVRSRCESRRYVDPRDGRTRRTYITSKDVEDLTYDWLRAFFTRNWVSPLTGRSMMEIRGDLEKHARAPTNPLTGDLGDAGGSLVPTIVQAEIFELVNEDFPLKGMVQVFQSAAPISINRRTVEVTVTRGGAATDIPEDRPEVGPVRLSPERMGVITYIDPVLAQASPVGPVRWVLEQMAEAISKDDQRTIIAGQPGQREPRGILSLPTSGGNAWDRAQTQAYDATTVLTERASMEAAYYAIPQKHRQSRSFAWVANDDGVREMHSHNDQNKKPFEMGAEGRRERYLNKEVVESLAIATAASATQIIGGDLNQYAWLENPEGLRLDQTTVGGDAWESDTIGVKAVQRVDGAPIIPGAFVVVTSVDV